MKKRTVVGGRGLKAPYKTSVLRVPDPLVPVVEKMMNGYREKVVNQNMETKPALTEVFMESLIATEMDDYLIEQSKEILKKKGTRKAALSKLLQVIFCRPIKEEELES